MHSHCSRSTASSTKAEGRVPAPSEAHAPPHVAALLLTPAEAQAVLRIGKTSLFTMLKSGEIRSIKLGRSRRIVAASLYELVARMADAG
ncbi:helix-turn-helix domain-containing protein [Nocardiopsis sp. TNDT3]|uniref:helix-turn-helix domain-containing protein n=1 Tax=Nocardiopsis sp. TNDT3 TaxID=2249354 RepID=UPI000E3E448C